MPCPNPASREFVLPPISAQKNHSTTTASTTTLEMPQSTTNRIIKSSLNQIEGFLRFSSSEVSVRLSSDWSAIGSVDLPHPAQADLVSSITRIAQTARGQCHSSWPDYRGNPERILASPPGSDRFFTKVLRRSLRAA